MTALTDQITLTTDTGTACLLPVDPRLDPLDLWTSWRDASDTVRTAILYHQKLTATGKPYLSRTGKRLDPEPTYLWRDGILYLNIALWTRRELFRTIETALSAFDETH